MGTKMENKVLSYLGFAARARKLVTGYNTCLYMMEKKKIRLLLLAEDLSENTKKKISVQKKKKEKKRLPNKTLSFILSFSPLRARKIRVGTGPLKRAHVFLRFLTDTYSIFAEKTEKKRRKTIFFC